MHAGAPLYSGVPGAADRQQEAPTNRVALRPAQADVIYGMYSGLALLMDVYRPTSANGFGVIIWRVTTARARRVVRYKRRST